VCFNGSKEICLIFLNLCLAHFSNLIWFEYLVFSLRSMGFLPVMKWTGFFCICFSNLVSCLPMVWRLIFVKLFCWMICLVFVRVSSPGNLYGVASTVWSL
jgi:hypothetical protein